MSLSRAIVQEASPATHRARILSVFTLGMMGGMPIGSALLGVIVEYLGVQTAALIPGSGMLIVLTYLYLRTNLYEIESKAV